MRKVLENRYPRSDAGIFILSVLLAGQIPGLLPVDSPFPEAMLTADPKQRCRYLEALVSPEEGMAAKHRLYKAMQTTSHVASLAGNQNRGLRPAAAKAYKACSNCSIATYCCELAVRLVVRISTDRCIQLSNANFPVCLDRNACRSAESHYLLRLVGTA